MAGGGSTRGSGGKKKARIEIIPLIDVIFFLLATFVLFTLALNKSNGPRVSLPDAQTGEPRDPSDSATITIMQDGTIAWNKDPITMEDFIARLTRYHAEHPEPDAHVLINGDADAMFSVAVYVLNEVRKSGIHKILIETHSKQRGASA
jgi:biopolymer transport protein ExbD